MLKIFVGSTSYEIFYHENFTTYIAFVRYYSCVFGFRAAHARARAGVKSRRTYGESNCHGRVFERNCCIRGYHVGLYKEIWEAVVGEALVCGREPENASDRYTVAVKKEGTIIGGGTGGTVGAVAPTKYKAWGHSPHNHPQS